MLVLQLGIRAGGASRIPSGPGITHQAQDKGWQCAQLHQLLLCLLPPSSLLSHHFHHLSTVTIPCLSSSKDSAALLWVMLPR